MERREYFIQLRKIGIAFLYNQRGIIDH